MVLIRHRRSRLRHRNGKERWRSGNSVDRQPIPLSSYGLATPQDEVKQSKENEDMQEFKEWLDKISQNAKQNSVQLKKEIINSQMSAESSNSRICRI